MSYPYDPPEPYEPPAEVLQLVNTLIDQARTSQSWHTGETFVQCLVCGEWEGHADNCPMPALIRWQTDDEPSKPNPLGTTRRLVSEAHMRRRQRDLQDAQQILQQVYDTLGRIQIRLDGASVAWEHLAQARELITAAQEQIRGASGEPSSIV